MKRFIVTLALGTAVYGAFKLYKAIAPCYAAAKEWDKEFSQAPFSCSGIITFKFRSYSLHVGAESIVFFNDSIIPEGDPEWVTDGLDELSIEASNPKHVGEQAKFAAKYSMSKFKLDDKVNKEIKLLGIAYFEKSSNFTPHQLELIKNALIYRLSKF